MSSIENGYPYKFSSENVDEALTTSIEADPQTPFLTAETGVSPNMDHVLQVAERATPAEIAMVVLEEVGLAPQKELVEQYRQDAQAMWSQGAGNIPETQQESYQAATEVVRLRDLLEQRVANADTYQQWLWDDYKARKGQNVDAVSQLFDDTEAYNNSSVIKAFDTLSFRIPGDSRVQDAERIIRYMIRGEARSLEQ